MPEKFLTERRNIQLRLIGIALFASLLPATAWSQPPDIAELEVPLGQIQAYSDDFRRAMDSCLGQQGVAVRAGQPLTDDPIRARRQCYGQVQTEFDLYTASFCPSGETGMAASKYVALCVDLNQRILPCLREPGYPAVVGKPIRPEDYAYLRRCREQAGADMAVAKHCGPPAFSDAP